MSNELNPCPFCGGAAVFQKAETGEGEPAEYVTCADCSASTAMCFPCMSGPRDALTRRWNVRTPAAEPVTESAWPEYIAGMVAAYLGGGVEDERIKPIAGIIRRRMWSASKQPAQGIGPTDEQIRAIWDAHIVPAFGRNGINPIVFARALLAQAPAAEPLTADDLLSSWRKHYPQSVPGQTTANVLLDVQARLAAAWGVKLA